MWEGFLLNPFLHGQDEIPAEVEWPLPVKSGAKKKKKEIKKGRKRIKELYSRRNPADSQQSRS